MRLFPALQEARSETPTFLLCDVCMQTQPVLQRQMMRCGLEPPLPVELRADGTQHYNETTVAAWRDAPVCAGYACSLPEVAEVTRCFLQWEQGTLTDYLDGQRPTRVLLECLGELQGAIREHQVEIARRPPKKGA